MEWTKNQLQAIETRNKNILVAAAAGSGKTAVLVERIIRLIVEEKIDLDKLLVVTFTNAAASQMREKILEAIYKKLEENPQNVRLQKQIVLMNKASISTIHSFCLEVIRNYFYEIDISANFRIGDDSEVELLRQETLLDLFEEKYEENDKEFNLLLDCYTDYHGDEKLAELVLKIYKFIQSMPFPEEWLEKQVKVLKDLDENEDFSNTMWGKILIENLKETLENVLDEYLILKSDLKKYTELEKYYVFICDEIDKISNIKNMCNLWKEIENCNSTLTFPNWTTDNKVTLEIKEVAHKRREDLKKKVKDALSYFASYSSKDAIQDIATMGEVMEALKNLVIEFSNKYSQKKKEKNIIDFNDIEHLALKILVRKNENAGYERTEVAKFYASRFEAIAIDEYQDSNQIQEYLLSTVSRDNNIFMVGDVKQSIYKFRQAMPELFISKYISYPKLEERSNANNVKIQLFKNFRSRKNILDITNTIFENIMTQKLRGYRLYRRRIFKSWSKI